MVVRSWRSKGPFEPPPAGGLAPDIMSDQERVPRKDLRALADAIREYVGGGRGNLSTLVLRRYGDLVWLSRDDTPLGRDTVRLYADHRKGPFLPAMLSVAVDAQTFSSLLGTRQSFLHFPEMNISIPRRALLDDFRRTRVAAPQCAGFAEGTAALPTPPKAIVTAVPTGEDLGFATEGAGTTLLVLGSDGRFSSYSRLENETKRTDAGEWSRADDGLVRLCSHSSSFRPIEGDRLGLAVDHATYSKLPGLLSGLQRHLSARPAKTSFSPKAIERIAARALDKGRPAAQGCSCRRLVYGDEPVPRNMALPER